MSATDNWIKLYRWWQEHLKSRFNSSSTMISTNHHEKRSSLLHRRSSLMSFRSSNNSRSTNVKKRASFGGIEQQQISSAIGNGDFRYVRDSIRNKNSRSTTTVTNNKRSVN
jgi:hypothetical protein